jgi:hypothetical protein
MVYVTNRTPDDFEDMYAGNSYKFPAYVPVEVPEEAARHIFGYGEENRLQHLIRLGWTMTANDVKDGMKKLDKFVITKEKPEVDHSLSPVVTRVPLSAQRGGKRLASVE